MENTQNPNETQSSEFKPPRHWIGQEELDQNYWSDAKIQERRGQEFYDKPIETLEMLERLDEGGLRRRDFLTIMGASMAMASMACARRPVHKIIPYVVKPEEITPGESNFYASVEPETGYGILIKTREGRPIKLEGNPDHPLNRGGLGVRGQAALLSLYDPDRLKDPVAYNRAGGGKHKATWKEVDEAVASKLKTANRVRVLTGQLHSPSTRRLVNEFLAAFPNGQHVEFEVLGRDDLAQGQALSYGTAIHPHYRFDRADVVVSLGADFLGTWGPSEEYQRDWSTKRKLSSQNAAHAKLSKVIVFEPVMTVTGASADERHPIRPGDEVKVALALAYEIIVNRRQSRYAGDTGVSATLNGYKPEAVAQDIGLAGGAEAIRQTAKLLWAHRGNSLVVGGGTQSMTEEAVALQVAVNLLNSALENDGVTVDAEGSIPLGANSGWKALRKLIAEMNSGSVDVLIVHGPNPAYSLPPALGFEEALKKVPFVVTLGEHEDETALLGNYALPTHHFLENWGDSQTRKGVYAIQQPAIAPLFNSRAFEDALLAWIKAGQLRAGSLATQIAGSAENGTWHDYLQANWKSMFASQGNFRQFWETTLQKGVYLTSGAGRSSGGGSARAFRTNSLQHLPRYKGGVEGLRLALYQKCGVFDGRYANNPWLQQLQDPVTTVTWDNYLNLGPVLAKKMGLKNDDVVEVKAGHFTVELPVNVQPGMHEQVVSAAVGYGRTSVGRVGNGVGVNVYPFVQATDSGLTFSGIPVEIRKTGKAYKLAQTQWHHSFENRPVINDITLTQFRKNPETENHTDPHLRMKTVPTMWPEHKYTGHRWGMAIDLNSCTGCGACIVACQAENNIPVVGRDNVRVSREMHWIRIDRYYSGSPERPDVVFQPMLCQHCENAPCETVCPVLATVHDEEGLNTQAYNRCVGTRYCQNNCPYKVRRFNFFDHWKKYESTMNLAWNPDVTVRTRGIMEKCTFCIQRINEAKFKAKASGQKLVDGDIQVACQQTCSAGAIVFGDLNDPNSRVSQLNKDQRAFRVLEVLNARPMIGYLTKVRNKEEEAGSHDAHH